MMLAIGFCHLLLQSRAPVPRSPSMRSRLAHSDYYGFRLRHPPWRSCLPSVEQSSTQRFHAAEVALVLGPVSCLSRCFDEPACESLHSGPLIETAPRALSSRVREDFTRVRSGTTSIERCSSSTSVLRLSPRCTGNGPDTATLLGLWWFCRHQASHCTASPTRSRAAFCKHDCFG
jgi:hypothetical protein